MGPESDYTPDPEVRAVVFNAQYFAPETRV